MIQHSTSPLKSSMAQITSSHKIPVKDVCRMFHGDHPAQEVECGEQNGGHYGCCGSTGASAAYIDHVASMRAPQVTLEERRKKVIAGPAGKERRNGGVSPFQQMTKDDLIKECTWHNLPTDGLLKPSLYSQLREELKGIQRVPALCFPNQTSSSQPQNEPERAFLCRSIQQFTEFCKSVQQSSDG